MKGFELSLSKIFQYEELTNNINKFEYIDLPGQVDDFHLLKTVIKKDNIVINLDNINNFEQSHSQLFPRKENEDNAFNFQEDDSFIELKNKINFIKDSFFNQILSKEESKEMFEKINSNKKFTTKFNKDRYNSSIYFSDVILKEFNKEGKLEGLQDELIRQIEGLNSLQKENKSLISTIYQAPKEIKEIKYYRKIKPNGDSFYISFIYQYIRSLIPVGDGSIITRIINLEREYHILNPIKADSDNLSHLGDKYSITGTGHLQDLKNLSQAYTYLCIIYNLITVKNDIITAIKIFDLAFSYDKFFWKLLCLFMKSYIKEFLRKNVEVFDIQEYCIKNNLIPNKYFSIQNQKFDYELYINDNIIIHQKEPTLFIISIVPYIFDATLNLYINEEGSKNYDDINKLNKIVINPDGKIEINILYSSHSYHIIECDIDNDLDINEKISFDVCNIFNYTIGNEIKIIEKREEYIDSISGKCNKCNKEEFIQIKSINNDYPICLNCFKSIIDMILIKRYQNMQKEKFNYIEYYLKEIPLLSLENNNDLINLSSIEFFYIFNQNLFTYFRNIINNICDICGIFEKNKIIHKICGCRRCFKCAKEECGETIYFTPFEKKYIFNKEIIECKCGKSIKKVDYGSQIFNLLNSDEKDFCETEAKKRTRIYIEKYCMSCGIEIDKNAIGNNDKHFFDINFINKDVNQSEDKIEHRLCHVCFDENKKLSGGEKEINCIICNEKHIMNYGPDNQLGPCKNSSSNNNVEKLNDKNHIVNKISSNENSNFDEAKENEENEDNKRNKDSIDNIEKSNDKNEEEKGKGMEGKNNNDNNNNNNENSNNKKKSLGGGKKYDKKPDKKHDNCNICYYKCIIY